VRVLRLAPPPRGGAARAEHDLCAAVVRIEAPGEAQPADVLAEALGEAGLIVDALFGSGLDRALSAFHVACVERVNAAGALRLAVDVPSGLDADRGTPLPVCVAADATATMVAAKRGFAPGSPGARFAGQVVEVDIGLPWALHAPFLRDAPPALR
jgi:NAD(P)H-hydrate epimerase